MTVSVADGIQNQRQLNFSRSVHPEQSCGVADVAVLWDGGMMNQYKQERK
jgi:hypothetical protein